ncbi:hypothetical protein AX14_001874 [Amanita brunnescens Koide BX004]|nr:hypothetical protein AX14_001874 [Amanita brunnescens Koide BX004]
MSSRLSSIFGNAKSQDDIENGCRSIDVENGLSISDSASAMVLAGTDGNQGHIRMFANQVFSFSSRIINGSRKRGISDEILIFSQAGQSYTAPSKVRVVEQPPYQSREVIEVQEKQIAENDKQAERLEFQLGQAVQRVTELEDLVQNGKHLLGEVKDSANTTKAEMNRRLIEEQIAEAEEVAWQRVAELEASLKNKSILLQEAAEFAEKTKQDAQWRVAELEEYLRNKDSLLADAEKTKQDAQQQIAELEESAERGRSLPQMPGGLPTQADAMRMDVDEGSTGSFNNARLGEDHWSLFVSRDGGSTGSINTTPLHEDHRSPFVNREGGGSTGLINTAPLREDHQSPFVNREGGGSTGLINSAPLSENCRNPFVDREGSGSTGLINNTPLSEEYRDPFVSREGNGSTGLINNAPLGEDRTTGIVDDRSIESDESDNCSDILRRVTFPIPAPTRRSARDARGGTGPSRSRAISPSVSLALWQGITSPSRSRAVSPSMSPTPWQGIASPSLLEAKSQASRRESPALSQQARYFSRQPEFHESLDLREQSVSDEDATSRLASLEGKFDNLSSDVREMKDILLHSISVQSQQKSLPPLRFKDPPARVRGTEKTDLQRTVRAAMNACMGIKQDKDICKVADLPTVDDVDDYNNDPHNAAIKPSLDPMRPSFFSIRSEWNERLWKLLETDSLHDTGFDSAGMKQAFFN